MILAQKEPQPLLRICHCHEYEIWTLLVRYLTQFAFGNNCLMDTDNPIGSIGALAFSKSIPLSDLVELDLSCKEFHRL